MPAPSKSEPPLHQGSGVAVFPAGQRTDASLVEGARSGERAAVAAIWDRYSGFVRRVVYGALGPDPAVEDLTQEVFLGFMKGAGQLREAAALRGYLASIATRLVAMEIRRRRVRRWVGLTSTGDLPDVPTFAADSVHRAALASLERVLGRLTTRRRMAFVLRDVEGLEMLEVAAALDVSESTLRRELAFARSFVERASASEPALSEYLSERKDLAR